MLGKKLGLLQIGFKNLQKTANKYYIFIHFKSLKIICKETNQNLSTKYVKLKNLKRNHALEELDSEFKGKDSYTWP